MLSFFHFNDVYNIEPRKKDPVGGASKFCSLVKKLKSENENMKIFFGGDALSPSLISSVTRGKHIPPIFNLIGVDFAAAGNHDFDFGADRLQQMMKLCNFPWLLANIVYTNSNGDEVPLANAEKYVIDEINGIKIGIIGLAEEEWLACLTKLPESTKYIDQAVVGRELCEKLRQKGCQIIIALTHSREPQDSYLASNCPDIDIILGGHDHDYYIRNVNGIPILHSGSEFREGTLVKISLNEKITDDVENFEIDDSAEEWKFVGRRITCELKKYLVTSDIPNDEEMDKVLVELSEKVKEKMEHSLGQSSTDWDVRFEKCRLQENNVGSFLCDLMRQAYNADFGVLCGGTLRSNDVYQAGEIKMGDVMKILPFPDTVTVAIIKGKYIREALENGFQAYPSPEGRFPQISGARVEFAPAKPPGNRIVKFEIGGEPVDDEREYKIATKPFLIKGGDGYTALENVERLIVDDEGIPLATLIRNYFVELKALNALSRSKRVSDIVATAFTPHSPTNTRLKANPVTDGRIKIIQ